MSDEHTINLKFEDWEDDSSGLEDAELELSDNMEELTDAVKDLKEAIEKPKSSKPSIPYSHERARTFHPYDAEIEQAALDIGGGTNSRVRLSELRKKLAHLDQKKLEDRLWDLEIEGALTLYPLDDPREIGPEDKQAAMYTLGYGPGIGGSRPRHILYYGYDSGGRAFRTQEEADAYTREREAFLNPPQEPEPPQGPPEPVSTPVTPQGSPTSTTPTGGGTGGSGGSTAGTGVSNSGVPIVPPPSTPTPGGTGGTGGTGGGGVTPPPQGPPTPVTPPTPPGGGGVNPALVLALKALPWLVLYRSMHKFNDAMEKTSQSVMGFSQEVTKATVEARLLDLQANMRRADNIGDILGDYVSGMGQLNNSVKGLWDEVVRFFSNDMKTVLSILKAVSDTLTTILSAINYIRSSGSSILSTLLGTNYSIRAILRRITEWLGGKDEMTTIDTEIAEFFKIDRDALEEGRRGDPRP